MTEHLMENILPIVGRMQRLTNADAVVDAMLDALLPLGLDQVVFSKARQSRKTIEQLTLAKRIRSEQQDSYRKWTRIYSDRNYVDGDPVVRRMKNSWKPFSAREISIDQARDPRGAEIMGERDRIGFGDWLVVPVFDRTGLAGFVSIIGDDIRSHEPLWPAFHLMALHAFHQLHALSSGQILGKSKLTAREREVLTWVAAGKSAWEIGEILKIAKRTVDEHAQTACQKLGAVNRPQAVALAVRDGLIKL